MHSVPRLTILTLSLLLWASLTQNTLAGPSYPGVLGGSEPSDIATWEFLPHDIGIHTERVLNLLKQECPKIKFNLNRSGDGFYAKGTVADLLQICREFSDGSTFGCDVFEVLVSPLTLDSRSTRFGGRPN